MERRVLSCFVVVLAAGCGGSSSDPVVRPTVVSAATVPLTCIPAPEGPDVLTPASVVGGSIVGRADPSFILVVQDDRRLLFYGPDLPATPRMTGYVRASNFGHFCDSNDRTAYNGGDSNFSLNTGSRVYLYSQVTLAPPSVAGTIRYQSSTYSLTGGRIPNSSYDTAARPSLADAVGSWVMTDLRGRTSVLSISDKGAVAGSDSGCPYTGTLTAASDATVNLLRVGLEMAACGDHSLALPFYGFALAVPLNDGTSRLLLWVETDNGVDHDYFTAIGVRTPL
jgi:hypothetical protein